MPRVFHCDDEPNYRSLVRVVLTRADRGYELVGEASDGREALEVAPALRPDVVLLDVNMPGMGGIAMAKMLREKLPAMPVLLASGYSHVLAQEGTHGFELLDKPYSAEQLGRILRRVTSDIRRATIA